MYENLLSYDVFVEIIYFIYLTFTTLIEYIFIKICYFQQNYYALFLYIKSSSGLITASQMFHITTPSMNIVRVNTHCDITMDR